MDPATGAHTQAIEWSWLDAKTMNRKRMRGVGRQRCSVSSWSFLLEHDEKNSKDLFVSFLEDVRSVHR